MLAMEEKDVYETEDLPEADQNEQVNNFDRCIEKIEISYESAKDSFKDVKLSSENTDFSDRIKPYFNPGYFVETNEYVVYPEEDRTAETPLQKFQRLQSEFRDLNNDIETIKEISKLDLSKEQDCGKVDLFDKKKEMDSLISQMHRIEMYTAIGTKQAETIGVDDELCGFETKEVFEDLRIYSAKHKKTDTSTKLSWEKYYRSPLSDEMELKKIGDLDERLLKLEAALGAKTNPSVSALGKSAAGCNTLVESARQLTARCLPLKGGSNVDKIEARLVNLQNKLSEVTEKRDLIKEADRQNKIANLFGLVEKWKTYQYDIKFVADRLEDLNTLHQQALQFPEVLNTLEKNQKQMKLDLNQYSANLKKITQSFVENVQKTESTIGNMQEKMNKLK